MVVDTPLEVPDGAATQTAPEPVESDVPEVVITEIADVHMEVEVTADPTEVVPLPEVCAFHRMLAFPWLTGVFLSGGSLHRRDRS